MKKLYYIATLVVVLLVGTASRQALAADLKFTEMGDTVVVTPDSNFELGVTTTASGETGMATGTFISNTFVGAGVSAILLVEPGTDIASDFLVVAATLVTARCT